MTKMQIPFLCSSSPGLQRGGGLGHGLGLASQRLLLFTGLKFSPGMVSYFPREYILSDNNGLGDTFSYSRLRLRATTTEEVQWQ